MFCNSLLQFENGKMQTLFFSTFGPETKENKICFDLKLSNGD